jgi:hypothetical protein
MTFDTLQAADRLEASGFNRKQSKALADSLKAASESGRGESASKADLAQLEVRLTWRIVAALGIQGGLIVALVKLL